MAPWFDASVGAPLSFLFVSAPPLGITPNHYLLGNQRQEQLKVTYVMSKDYYIT